MNNDVIMNNIDFFNKEELKKANAQLEELEKKVYEKYTSNGEYMITENTIIKKNYSLFSYNLETIKVPYIHYYIEQKVKESKELQGFSTTTNSSSSSSFTGGLFNTSSNTSFNPLDINGSTSTSGKSNSDSTAIYKTTYEYYDVLKISEKTLEKKIYIKNIMPNSRKRLNELETEFKNEIDMFLTCNKIKYPIYFKNKKFVLMTSFKMFSLFMLLLLMLVFPTIKSFNIDYGINFDFVSKYVSPYLLFLGELFNPVTFIIGLILCVGTFITGLIFSQSSIKEVTNTFDNIVSFLVKCVVIITLASVLYYLLNHFINFKEKGLLWGLVSLIGVCATFLRNLSYLIILIFIIYSIINLATNRFKNDIDFINYKISEENKDKRQFKENRYPYLLEVKDEIAVYSYKKSDTSILKNRKETDSNKQDEKLIIKPDDFKDTADEANNVFEEQHSNNVLNEYDLVNVILLELGNRKIEVIKTIKTYFDYSLAIAKKLADDAEIEPVLLGQLAYLDACRLKIELEVLGAIVEIEA